MNISELKDMAIRHATGAAICQSDVFARAILSLPDDDGEELVRLAERLLRMTKLPEFDGQEPTKADFLLSDANELARAVLSRYWKKEEPRKVSGWYIAKPQGASSAPFLLGFGSLTRQGAEEIARQQGPECFAVFVSGVEGAAPDAEGK